MLPRVGWGGILCGRRCFRAFCQPGRRVACIRQGKYNLLVDGVKMIGENERKIAESAIGCRIGCGDGVFEMMALQISLAMDVPPHESAKDGKMVGYDAVWHDTTFDDRSSEHAKFKLWKTGMFVGPDGPHESNHSEDCQRLYSGFTLCKKLAGINLNPHEQDHSRKALYLRSLNTMGFTNFTYSLRVLDERQNQWYNKLTVATLSRSVTKHPKNGISGCQSALWRCGRCFCSKPVMRVFDCWGGWTLSCLMRYWRRPPECSVCTADIT